MNERDDALEPPRRRFTPRSTADAPRAAPKVDLTQQLLADLHELSADAAAIAADGREQFLHADSGRLARHAADGVIVKVQEICERLPDQVRDRHPEIPWNAIRGVRNALGHNYRATDYRIVWNTIAVDIPALAQALKDD